MAGNYGNAEYNAESEVLFLVEESLVFRATNPSLVLVTVCGI